uniref:Uncharacterized protein n=1 Tax=Aegilops tauschii TaxID=37682 RepID=M8AWN2_AEGTA
MEYASLVELEQMLIDICWEHFDQGKDLYAEKDVSVKIFDAIKHRRRTRNLTVIVSDLGEDIVKGTYPIMGKEAMPVSYLPAAGLHGQVIGKNPCMPIANSSSA